MLQKLFRIALPPEPKLPIGMRSNPCCACRKVPWARLGSRSEVKPHLMYDPHRAYPELSRKVGQAAAQRGNVREAAGPRLGEDEWFGTIERAP